MPEPWDEHKRASIKRRLDREAQSAKKHLKADGVIVIALYADGEYHHTQDGHALPDGIVAGEVYRMLLTAYETLKASGGKDVSLN